MARGVSLLRQLLLQVGVPLRHELNLSFEEIVELLSASGLVEPMELATLAECRQHCSLLISQSNIYQVPGKPQVALYEILQKPETGTFIPLAVK